MCVCVASSCARDAARHARASRVISVEVQARDHRLLTKYDSTRRVSNNDLLNRRLKVLRGPLQPLTFFEGRIMPGEYLVDAY